MMLLRLGKLLFLSLFITGCASNIYYFEQASKQESTQNNTTSLFIDAFGGLYPKETLPKHWQQTNSEFEAMLFKLFHANNQRCDELKRKQEAYLLCKASAELSSWRDAQSTLWQSRADYIFSQIEGQDKDLVILIHGFNNEYKESSSNISLLVDEVEKYRGNKAFFFVKVFWDGFTTNTGLGAWGKAQSSGPLAGFQLRQLLNALSLKYDSTELTPRLVFLTHSSGAFVAGSTLGNPIYAQQNLQNPGRLWDYGLFHKYREGNVDAGHYRIPRFRATSLGMFAAATPSTTFTHTKVDKDEIGSIGLLSNNTSLVLSINPRDFALGKGFRLYNFSFTGSTDAGASEEKFCKRLAQMPFVKPNVLKVRAINYESQNHPFYDIWDEHGLGGNEGYLSDKNRKRNATFFDAILHNNYGDPNNLFLDCSKF